MVNKAPRFDFQYKKQEIYHKPAPKIFATRTIITNYPREIFGFDLVDYSKVERDGYKYIMIIMDIFSRRVWARKLKSKDTKTIKNAMVEIFAESGNPEKLWSDQEPALKSKEIVKYLEDNNIYHYHTYSAYHVAPVERFNRTLKGELYKYEMDDDSHKWTDFFDIVIDQYNSSEHSTLKTSPNAVWNSKNPKMKEKIANIYHENDKKEKEEPDTKFKVGDRVRLSTRKDKFTKGYTENWTQEIFTISEIKMTNPKTYLVKDAKGDAVKGSYYGYELMKTKN